jgi:hypothetical protein
MRRRRQPRPDTKRSIAIMNYVILKKQAYLGTGCEKDIGRGLEIVHKGRRSESDIWRPLTSCRMLVEERQQGCPTTVT